MIKVGAIVNTKRVAVDSCFYQLIRPVEFIKDGYIGIKGTSIMSKINDNGKFEYIKNPSTETNKINYGIKIE